MSGTCPNCNGSGYVGIGGSDSFGWVRYICTACLGSGSNYSTEDCTSDAIRYTPQPPEEA
jgi:hypothetical protein